LFPRSAWEQVIARENLDSQHQRHRFLTSLNHLPGIVSDDPARELGELANDVASVTLYDENRDWASSEAKSLWKKRTPAIDILRGLDASARGKFIFPE
jgi:hypothetical protein